MFAGNGRWAKYGAVGALAAVLAALVAGIANLEGVLSMIDRISGSSGPPEVTAPHRPEHTPSITATDPPITADPRQPEPQATTRPTAPPPATTTRTPPPAKPTVAPPTRAGALVITIRMGSGGKIGPSEYRAGAAPGANVDVYDDIGQLSAGCYPSWALTREGTEVQKARNGRCTSGGITMFNFSDSLDTPGTYRLSVNVVTDANQTGSSFVDFIVR